MNTYLFLIIIAVILGFKLLQKINCNFNSIDSNLKDKLYKLLENVDKLFNEKGIEYWAEGGTLLGIVRHQELIPWDDDIDICVLESDTKKIENLKEELNNLGLEISPVFFGYKIYPINGKPVKRILRKKTYNFKYPFLDVFVRKNKNNSVVLSRTKWWKNSYFKMDEVFPRKKYKLGKMYIYGPNKPINYLNRTYKKSWDKQLVSQGEHYKNEKKKTCKNYYHLIDFSKFT